MESFSFIRSFGVHNAYYRQIINRYGVNISHRFIDLVVKCSPMVRQTGVQSQVVIPKTQKVVLDTSLLNTQHYKVRFKGKVEQSRERSSALSYISV